MKNGLWVYTRKANLPGSLRHVESGFNTPTVAYIWAFKYIDNNFNIKPMEMENRRRTLYREIIRSTLIQALKHLKDDGRLEEDYIQEPKKVINPEKDRINRLEGIMEKYEIKFGIEIQSLQDKFDIIEYQS